MFRRFSANDKTARLDSGRDETRLNKEIGDLSIVPPSDFAAKNLNCLPPSAKKIDVLENFVVDITRHRYPFAQQTRKNGEILERKGLSKTDFN